MNKPKVSIITPTFNRAGFIERTVRSVLAQTYDNVEYIIVDGGSADSTVEILDKYAQQGKLMYISEPDNGMYDAINKGFRMSSGDILAYLNSDDAYFPWTISTAVDRLMNERVDLVCGDTLVQDVEGNTIRLSIWPRVSACYLKTGHLIAQPTVFMKRKMFLNLGDFGKEVKLLGDCEYWLRAMEANYRIENVHELLAIECDHEETIRVRLRQQIDAEKAFLRTRYKAVSSRIILSGFYTMLKFLERETTYLGFKILLSQKLGNLAAWQNFRASYVCKFSLFDYYVSKAKIAKLYDRIWYVKKRTGSSLSMGFQNGDYR